MKKNQTFSQKIFGLSAIVLLGSTVLLAVSSCKENKKEAETSFTMNAVMITKAQVEAWMKSGWINPADSNGAKHLLLQFYSDNTSKASSNMQLVAFPAKSFTKVIFEGKTILANDPSRKAKTFSGPAIFASSYICLDYLNFLNKDGSLKNFDKIILAPNQDNPPYIGYSIAMESPGGENSGLKPLALIDTTKNPWPCPPYCCPGPCCPLNETFLINR